MDVCMPKYGMTMVSGEVAEWFVKVGDSVEVGTELGSVATEKLTNTLESPVAGVVSEIVAEEGDEVAVGGLLLKIEEK